MFVILFILLQLYINIIYSDLISSSNIQKCLNDGISSSLACTNKLVVTLTGMILCIFDVYY